MLAVHKPFPYKKVSKLQAAGWQQHNAALLSTPGFPAHQMKNGIYLPSACFDCFELTDKCQQIVQSNHVWGCAIMDAQQMRRLACVCRPLREGGAGGLQEGSLEAVRYLLDPESMTVNVERNEFLDVFYDHHLGALVRVLTDSPDR